MSVFAGKDIEFQKETGFTTFMVREHDKRPVKRRAGHRVEAGGGVDAPSNMQWQTIHAVKAKDKTE
jgi:hypothetical protein